MDQLNNFFFFFGDDKVYYQKYDQRANLRKRTQTANDYTAESEIQARPSEYTIIYREPSEEEISQKETNTMDLESDLFGVDDDEEDEDGDQEEIDIRRTLFMFTGKK